MKRLLLWGWIVPDCRAAVDELVRAGSIEVAFWIADSNEAPVPFTKFLYKQPEFGALSLPPGNWELANDELVKFLEMFSREKRSRGLDFHEQAHIAKNYFRFFCYLFRKQSIDHALFEMVPLTGLDYICYLAALRAGVRTTLCYQSNFPNRFFYCHKIEDFGTFSEIRSVRAGDPPEIEWGFEKDLFYMQQPASKRLYGKTWPRFLKELWRYGIRQSSKPVRMSGVVQSFVQGLDYDRLYKSLARVPTADELRAKFVYFPLHLQPEMTTSGLGGVFSDQVDAIESLREILPAEWWIFVKENPYQGCEHRGAEFFNRLKSLPKVKYISKEFSTYTLIENCQFVATVTGTAGWEAITGGKPCLVFGLAWYLGLPGVARYGDGKTAEEIAALSIDRERVTAAFSEVYSKSRCGIYDPGFEEIYPSYSREDNIAHLAKFVREVTGC